MIDTQTKRRSVSGYSNLIIAPLVDGLIDAADREHMAGLYAGIASNQPTSTEPYSGDTTIYDLNSATGSITGGTVIPPEYIYYD